MAQGLSNIPAPESDIDPAPKPIQFLETGKRRLLLFQNELFEYTDPEVYRIVSPVWQSRALMGTKRMVKPLSIATMVTGAGIALFYTGSSLVKDGGGIKDRKERKNGLLIGGLGLSAFMLQMPLSKLSISIFNEKYKGR